MAPRSFKESIEQKLGKFPSFLVYIILEWVLIILLFIDGLIAFSTNEFARYFGLRIPCLLCTRIDHVIVHRDPGFYYNDSICEGHKKDLSSLAYCHVHRKISDIRFLCEGCLLSFATENKSNRETFRSLVGILGTDLECSVEDDNKIHLRLPAEGKDDSGLTEKNNLHRCSCCGEPLRIRSSPRQVLNPIPGSYKAGSSQGPLSPRRRLLMGKKEELYGSKYNPETEFESPQKEKGENRSSMTGKENAAPTNAPLLTEGEELNEDSCKTPSYMRANRLFRIAFDESATASPRTLAIIPRSLPEPSLEQSENSSSETDGEAIMRQSKRHFHVDRKTLIAMCMELDEERNASAIAANEAMAMITRLQEEKAAFQMEALQYQRMMEEQAEYDQEAIRLMQEQLTKKEEEIRELKESREDLECGEDFDFFEEDTVGVEDDITCCE